MVGWQLALAVVLVALAVTAAAPSCSGDGDGGCSGGSQGGWVIMLLVVLR